MWCEENFGSKMQCLSRSGSVSVARSRSILCGFDIIVVFLYNLGFVLYCDIY